MPPPRVRTHYTIESSPVREQLGLSGTLSGAWRLCIREHRQHAVCLALRATQVPDTCTILSHPVRVLSYTDVRTAPYQENIL